MTIMDLDAKLAALGITPEIRSAYRLPPCTDTPTLVDAGEDMFGRRQLMTEKTRRNWLAMKEAALKAGIQLKLVSAYRSIEYQCDLIRRKLADGRSIEDILRFNAIPGYSEHHTGRAVDLYAGDGEPLEEEFERQPAYIWLTENAGGYRFRLSYPRNNSQGVAYEPWHWCCEED